MHYFYVVSCNFTIFVFRCLKRCHDEGSLQEKAFNWELAYSFMVKFMVKFMTVTAGRGQASMVLRQ